ncbi:MAG: hypothetical protein KME20_17195 [Kaiparowitsia implicata GSE-PSE-MK54-09C]|jgi:hypothetical protein|nr:hypothetical protein [Kaiparowitsia implicata GSE-PSE-MK54-09C]
MGLSERSPEIRNSPEGKAPWNVVPWLISRLWYDYPLVFWSGVFTLMLLVAGIGMTWLIDPDLSQDTSLNSDPSQFVAATPSRPRRDTNASPFVSYGATVLTCMAGCLLLSQRLRTPSQKTATRVSRRSLQQSRVAAHHPSALPTASLLDSIAEAAPSQASDPASRVISPYVPTPASLPPALTNTQPRMLPQATTPIPKSAAVPEAAPALPRGDRPEFQVPVRSPQRDRAPGLAELLDIRDRRSHKSGRSQY